MESEPPHSLMASTASSCSERAFASNAQRRRAMLGARVRLQQASGLTSRRVGDAWFAPAESRRSCRDDCLGPDEYQASRRAVRKTRDILLVFKWYLTGYSRRDASSSLLGMDQF